ncbi:DegT/DnrJ/EryC1/StrS aminotransferase family protein [Lachnospiraceae bacterium XBD2001]|nr:DegT/DnrJ/EryC1/StrS aminotransferase family protein [Lachnospiraceae bacterium XBD2001]
MLLGRELPTWKQLLNKDKSVATKPYYEKDNTWLFAESCMSIHAILQAIRKNKMAGANLMDESRSDSHKNLTQRTDGVALWLPDYFCNDTFRKFEEDWLEVFFYPVDKNRNPKWDVIEEEAKNRALDAFVFVHYFGMYHEIGRARELCSRMEGILIEDCAHVMYTDDASKIGKTGDFVCYSMHKLLPIPDGAALQYNSGASHTELLPIVNILNAMYENTAPQMNDKSWFHKKAIQKITKLHRDLTYYYGEHLGEYGKLNYPIHRISQWSYNILSGYSYEDLQKIAAIRRANVHAMNEIITKHYPQVKVVSKVTDDEVPYEGVYSLAEVPSEEEKKRIVSELVEQDFTILFWPELPFELKYNRELHADAIQLSKDIFVIPSVHQDYTPELLHKKFDSSHSEKR